VSEESADLTGLFFPQALQNTATRNLYQFQFSVAMPKWVILELFKQLPPDAHLVSCGHDVFRDNYSLVIWSKAFPEREMGESIEILSAIVHVNPNKLELTKWNRQTNSFERMQWVETTLGIRRLIVDETTPARTD